MKALTWQGNSDVAVADVPGPCIEQPTDAIIRFTSTAICGSDLQLSGVLGPYLRPGDVSGHEAMGIVEELGSEVAAPRVGDRGAVLFSIQCGHCWMCERTLFAQCDSTQVRSEGNGVDLTTRRLPLADAPAVYEGFCDTTDGCIKVVLQP